MACTISQLFSELWELDDGSILGALPGIESTDDKLEVERLIELIDLLNQCVNGST